MVVGLGGEGGTVRVRERENGEGEAKSGGGGATMRAGAGEAVSEEASAVASEAYTRMSRSHTVRRAEASSI